MHITPYVDTATRCSIQSWYPTSPDLTVGVRCFGLTGEPRDTKFNLTYQQ